MMSQFWNGRTVVVTGGQGLLGARVMACLTEVGARAVSCSRRTGCDLRSVEQALAFFERLRPDIVINCAANQGGIAYQRLHPGMILYDNVLMSVNTIEAARRAGVAKYVNVVAGCAYPGEPRDGLLREAELEAGPMHPTVENYGIAKRVAVHQARDYRRQYGFDAISLVLINLYGPGEHFHPDRSHALAALLRKFYEAKREAAPEVVVWGTGRAVREWLYVDDAAEGMLLAAERYGEDEPLNIAVGRGCSISELAAMIQQVVGYEGRIVYDTSKPDGALYKVADVTRMRGVLGWEPPTPLEEGIQRLLAWFDAHYEEAIRDTT